MCVWLLFLLCYQDSPYSVPFPLGPLQSEVFQFALEMDMVEHAAPP